MRRVLVTFALVLLPALVSAQQNVTVRDILELTKAGLGEEALLALIEVNRPVFPVDVDTLKALKAAGVPPAVITAMIRSGRSMPPAPGQQPDLVPTEPYPQSGDVAVAPAQQVAPSLQAPPAQVVVIDHREDPVVREVPVAYPVYVAVPVRRSHGRVIDRPSRPSVVEPVFWGWDGKLRPDAWKPAIELQKDAKVPLVPQRK